MQKIMSLLLVVAPAISFAIPQDQLIQPVLPIVEYDPANLGKWNEDVRDAVVKITNRVAPVWGNNQTGGHGTGFIVGIREIKNADGVKEPYAVIFTNKHVVNKPRMFAQQLSVNLHVRSDRHDMLARSESVVAKIQYVSEVLDFAVLNVKLADIKRATPKILKVAQPGTDEYEFYRKSISLSGTPTTAVGFPFDGDYVFTRGSISTAWTHPIMGTFIQTDTPINPGNSGGPLISLVTGHVLGINSMTRTGDQDGTHWALPIKEVWEEFSVCESCHDKNLSRSKLVPVDFVQIEEILLEKMGLKSVIEAALPRYFDYYGEMLKVGRADPDSGLLAGDIVLKVDGREMPPSIFEFRKRLQRLSGSIRFTILRDDQILEIETKIHDSSFFQKRREVDFVNLSGLFMQESSARHRYWARPTNTPEKVFVAMIDTTTPPVTNINPGSFVAGLRYQSQRDTLIPIHSLFDLKQALKNIPPGDNAVILRYYPSVTTYINGRMTVARDMLSGYPAVRANYEEAPVLLTRLITPQNLSVAKFLKKFNPKDPTQNWNWQFEVDQTGCQPWLTTKNP